MEQTFISHSCWWWLSWLPFPQGLSCGCHQAFGWGCILIWKLNWGRFHFQAHSVPYFWLDWELAVCLQETSSVPCCKRLSTWQFASLRTSKGESKKGWKRQKIGSFCKLNLEVTSQKPVIMRSSPHPKAKDYRRAWALGGKDSWGYRRNWVPYFLTTFSDFISLMNQQT